jgi:hypothetical protein
MFVDDGFKHDLYFVELSPQSIAGKMTIFPTGASKAAVITLFAVIVTPN